MSAISSTSVHSVLACILLHPKEIRIKCYVPKQEEEEEGWGIRKTYMWAGLWWYLPLRENKVVAHEYNLCMEGRTEFTCIN